MQLKPGVRLRSAVDATEVVVVKAPGGDADLRCGGHPMVPADATEPDTVPVVSGHDRGTSLGKRYTDSEGALEVLCVKGGDASLSVDGQLLEEKAAKPLPSSD